MARLDVRRLILGTDEFFDDVEYKGMYGVMVRSPYAHARILAVDGTEAERYGGKVLTAEAMKRLVTKVGGEGEVEGLESTPLATAKAVYQGEPVAFVLSEDPYRAVDVADLVRVEYEPLKPVASIEDALTKKALLFEDSGTNIVSSKTFEYGVIPTSSPKRIDLELYWGRSLGNPIEPFGVIAMPEKDGLLMISNAQAYQFLVGEAEEVLGVRIRHIPVRQGGSFGAKFSLLRYMLIVGFAALHFDLSVKWVETRREHLMACEASGPEREFRVSAYFDGLGKVNGVDMEVWEDIGATKEGMQALKAANILSGPYKIRNIRYVVHNVATNKNPAGAFRGAGTPPHSWAMERIMDRIADELGLDRGEVRRRNVIDSFPYETQYAFFDSGNPKGLLDLALSRIDLFSMRSSDTGVGIALSTDPSTPSASTMGEGVKLSVRSGKIVVGLGYSPEGQGNEHTAVILASRLLGVPTDDVTYEILDTLSAPKSFGPGGSRMAAFTAGAIEGAVKELIREAGSKAKSMLGVENIEYSKGYFYSSPDRSVRITELDAEVDYVFHLKGKSNFVTYPFACDIAVVKLVDGFRIKPLKHVVYIDPGIPIDEEVVKEQIQGGTAIGVSLALYERALYDEEANLMTTTLADYGMPTASDLPDIEVNIVPTASTSTPMGVKGIGEIPVGVAAAAVTSAVEEIIKKRIDSIPVEIQVP